MAQQLSLLELLERPTLEALVKPDQIFTSNDWEFVAKQFENTRLDRKSGRIAPTGLAECLSAFGNGPAVEGGVVLIGIEKDGVITGVHPLQRKRFNNWNLWDETTAPMVGLLPTA